MALAKCKECRQTISFPADKRPKCSAKAPATPVPLAGVVVLLIVIGGFAACDNSTSSTNSSTATKSQWSHATTKDELTGKPEAFAFSPAVGPETKMDFPYNDVHARLGVGCDGASEHAFIGFDSAPNLSDTQITEDGYYDVTTRIRWGDKIEYVKLRQKPADSLIVFIKTAKAIANMAHSKSALLELEWYGQGSTYFKFPLDGSAAAIAQIRAQCSRYSH